MKVTTIHKLKGWTVSSERETKESISIKGSTSSLKAKREQQRQNADLIQAKSAKSFERVQKRNERAKAQRDARRAKRK